MNKEEIIKKYRKEIENIDIEIDKRAKIPKSIRYLQGMRFSILLFLSDLKNLS